MAFLLAVEYARFSSIGQREESIDAQFRAIREYAGKNNVKIIGSFKDEAVSGKTDARDDFQRMISAILKKEIKVDVVLVHKFNRFARSKYDSAIYKKRLKDMGVKVISVSQLIDDTPEGELLEGFLETIDQYYSNNLAAEVRKGIRENAFNGKHTGGIIPFGFSLDENRRYVPNEDAAVVKRIFEDYANGKQTKQIVEDLRKDGYTNQKGTPFVQRTIYDLLRNEKYIGNYAVTIKGVQTVRLDGIIAPIISRELWEKVRKRNRTQKARIGKSNQTYFLTGKTVCGCCGATISGAGSKRRRKDGDKVFYYGCNGRYKQKNGCDNPIIQKEWLEKNVLKTVLLNVMDDETILNITDIAYNEFLNMQEKPAVSTEKLQSELYNTLSELKNLTKLYLKGKIDDAILDEESDNLNRRKFEIEAELEERKNKAHLSISKEYLFAFFTDYIAEILRANPTDSADFMRVLFETFAEKIIVNKEDVRVIFRPNLTPAQEGDSVRAGGAVRILSTAEVLLNIDRMST